MFQALLERIESFQVITIFRHISEDCDALGSTFGLKAWIQEHYPKKQVYVLGERVSYPFYPQSDEITDSCIAESLALVLDCANAERIDDHRYVLAKDVIAIDHHPYQDAFMSLDVRDVSSAATCQILSDFFRFVGYPVSKEVATSLYRGLLTDTMSFKTNNTTPQTLQAAAFLCECGIDIKQCNHDVYDVSLEMYDFSNYIRNHSVYSQGVVYTVLSIEELLTAKQTPSLARSLVYIFNGVKEYDIWGIFTEEKPGIFNGSLRSKDVIINDIAEMYRGGGHKNACGVKGLSRLEIDECIEKLKAKLSHFE